MVVWDDVNEAQDSAVTRAEKTPDDFGWPPGFFERFQGALAEDDSFVRPEDPRIDPIAPLDAAADR